MAAAVNSIDHLLAHSVFDCEEEELQGQIQAWYLTFSFASSMAVKAACLLRIPDILANEGRGAALTLQEIASRLSSSCSSSAQQLDYLHRIMRFLCSQGFFSVTMLDHNQNSEPKYGLTPVSKWLVQSKSNKDDASFAPMTLMQTSTAAMAPWHHLSECVLQGGFAFEKAHGLDVWSFSNKHPDFNNLFNDAMACSADIFMKCLLKHYHGFANIGTLVDVGGGTGTSAARITAHYPSIKAINFDLPHVVATAPSYGPGVEHFGGDMFKSIPSTDAIFMKWIMHDWDDENCIRILKNCREAIRETGKVIIVDSILDTDKEGSDPFAQMRLVMDLVMIAHVSGGKERTKAQWEALLVGAGFPRYNIIHLPSLHSVIEAFPS